MRKMAMLLAAVLTLNLVTPAMTAYAEPVDVETESIVENETESEEALAIETPDEEVEEPEEELSPDTEIEEDEDQDLDKDVTNSESEEKNEKVDEEIEDEDEIIDEENVTDEEMVETPLEEELTVSANSVSENTVSANSISVDGTPLEVNKVYLQDTYYNTASGYPLVAAMDLPIENRLDHYNYSYSYPSEYSTRLMVNAMYLIIDDGEPRQIDIKEQLIARNGDSLDGVYPEVQFAFNAGYIKGISTGEHKLSYVIEFAWDENWCNENTDTIYSVTTPEQTVEFVDEGSGNIVYEAVTQYMPAYKGSEIKSIYGSFSVPTSGEKISKFKIVNHDTGDAISYDVVNKYTGTPWASYDSRYENVGKFYASQLFERDCYRAYYSSDIRLKEEIPEGDYDIIYTTSKGRTFTNEKAYRATKQTIVYEVRETSLKSKNSTYDAVPVFSDNSGEYVSVFVYGLNLTKANVPTFYGESSNIIAEYSADDKGCGVEEWEYGYDYSLKKTASFGEGASLSVKVSGDNVLYVKNYTVDERPLVYQYGIDLVNRSELNKDAKYFRIYFTQGTVSIDESVSITVDSYPSQTEATGTVQFDGEEYYVEFVEGSGLYSSIVNGMTYYDVIVSAGGRTDTFMVYDVEKPKTVTNITVPANCSWEIHSAKDVGSIIYSGSTTTKKAVLTDSQIAKLKDKHAYRVCIYDKNGNVASNGRYLVYFIGTEIYNISYELDGGNNHPENPTEYGKNDSYTLLTPTKEYHTFAGWYSDEKLTKKVTSIARGSKGDKTLYAKWTPYTYTVNYNANGGSGSVRATNGQYNVDTKIAKNTFKRVGYSFVEWNTDKDGNGDSYSQEDELQFDISADKEKIQLYAIWEPLKYQLVLDKNSDEAQDGTIEAADNEFDVEYGETYTLTGEEYYRKGYEITSWKTAKGKKVANGDIKNLTTVAGDKVTLYAQWAIDKYNLTYDYDGGKVKKANPKTYTYDMTKDKAITLNIPEKKGYVFEGYFEVDPNSNQFTGEEIPVTEIGVGEIGDRTFYAKWRPVSYTIILNSDGTDGAEKKEIPCEYDQIITFEGNELEKAGYTLTAFTTKENGTGTKYTVGKNYKNLLTEDGKEINLYANWKKTTYTITYNLDGGKNDNKNPKTYTIDSADFELKPPTKKGYMFENWYVTNEDGTLAETPIKEITGDLNSNLVLTAKWNIVQYYVKLYPNTNDYLEPGYDEYTLRYLEYNTEVDPNSWDDIYQPSDLWKKQGYGVIYWSTKPNGSGTKYYPGKVYFGLGTNDQDIIELYANWGIKKYSISYEYITEDKEAVDKTGIKNSNPTTFTYDYSKKISLKDVTKTGYTFKGWYTDPSLAAEYEILSKSIERNKCEDITLYAQLKPIEYTIQLNPNGTDVAAKDGLVTRIELDYDDSYELYADAYTREHYQFDCWTTKANGSGTKVALTGGNVPLTKVDGAEITLYPKWVLTPYDIIYNNVTFENEKVTNNNPQTYTYNEKKDVALKNPTRPGYVFSGWYEEDTTVPEFDASTATKITKIAKGSGGDKVLYALWTPIRYKVKLNANAKDATSSEGTNEITEIAYGDELSFASDSYYRVGYNLVDFNSKANGKGISYGMGQNVKIYATKANSTVNVYAIWEKVKTEKVEGIELSSDSTSITVNFTPNEGCNQYEVAISPYFTMTNATVKLAEDGNAVFNELESGKRYYIRVREVRFDSRDNEIKGAWSSLKSIKTMVE